MEHLNYNDERTIAVLSTALQRDTAYKSCIDTIDLSSVSNSNLGESKFSFEKCLTQNGFSRQDFTNKSTRTYQV